MIIEPQSQFAKSSTYPKCPICNIRWYQQIDDGNIDITCVSCGMVWKPTEQNKGNAE